MRFIKKHKYKLLTLMLSIVSIFTLFLGINKTYAYESNEVSYTLDYTYNETTIGNYTGVLLNHNMYYDYVFTIKNNGTANENQMLIINLIVFDENDNVVDRTMDSSYFRFYYNSSGTLYSTINYGRNWYNNIYTRFWYIYNTNMVNSTQFRFRIDYRNSTYKYLLLNADLINPNQIGMAQYYGQYYEQIEENYNSLLSDYNDLQDNYDSLQNNYQTLEDDYSDLQNNYSDLENNYDTLEDDYSDLLNNYAILQDNYNDLQTTYNQLESTYNNLQDNYNDLLESFNDLNSSIDSNIVSTLVGDNYFVKTNYQFTNTNSTTESYSNSINNYRWGFVNGTNINGNTFNIGNALLESLSFVPMYTTSFNDSNFSYLDFSMYYNTPLVLEHYTATGIGNINTQDNYAWSNGSLISCKYINIEISSSIDLLIQYKVLNQDGTNDTFIVSRDSTNQKYIISFDNDDNRVLTNLRIQCKYINNNWVTADSVVCNISNVGDDNYTLGYQNGYNVGLSENATNNEINNKKIADLTSQISSQHFTIRSLQEQISAFNSDYNLNNLMWTIASTPFDSFKQIWNVEFFGVNIASIVTGFLTGIIALWVLKKFFL